MRPLFIPVFLAALFLSLVSTTESESHHGGHHPAWEVDEFEDDSFRAGLEHPFTGFDHLLGMLVVGMFTCLTGRLEIGVVFVGAIGLGFAAGFASPGWLLALSVIVTGLLLILCSRRALLTPLILVAGAGLVQGGAHGSICNGSLAGLGLCLGTAIGVGLGAALARVLGHLPPLAMRLAGASVVVVGIRLLAAASVFSG